MPDKILNVSLKTQEYIKILQSFMKVSKGIINLIPTQNSQKN